MPNFLNYCVICIAYTRFTNVAAGRMTQPGGPRVGDPRAGTCSDGSCHPLSALSHTVRTSHCAACGGSRHMNTHKRAEVEDSLSETKGPRQRNELLQQRMARLNGLMP